MSALIARWFARWHRVVLALALLGSAAAIAGLVTPGLHESYTISSFVGSTNPHFDGFEAFMREFSGGELALIAVRSDDALAADSLACLRTLTRQCRDVPAVDRTRSVGDMPVFLRGAWIDHPLVRGLLVSNDGRTAAVILQMAPESRSGDVRRQTVAALRAIVDAAAQAHPGMELILTGPYVTMLEMFELVHRDLLLFSITIAVLMAVALVLTLRSWRGVALALGVAASATLTTLGICVALALNMSLLTQMIVIMTVTLAVSTCVHLSVACQEDATAAQDPRPPRQRTCSTLQRMLAPCSAVLLTSAAGFAAVMLSEIRPIRTFGAIMASGLVLAGIVAFAAVFPAGAVPGRAAPHPWLLQGLRRAADSATRRPRCMVAIFVVLAIGLAWPIPGLRFESEFVRNFRAASPVRRGYEFVERNLAPLNSIELIIRAPADQQLITPATVRACAAIARDAQAAYAPIRKAVSIADVLSVGGGGLPVSDADLEVRLGMIGGIMERLFGPDAMTVFSGRDGRGLRVSLLAREGVDVHTKLAMAGHVRELAVQHVPPGYQVELTGLYYFYATLIAGLVADQNRTFAVALVAIYIMSGLWLRSWRLAALAMIPNLLTMIACLGLMGWLGIPVNMATAMMLSISLGVAVDDTLHYLYRFRSEIARDGDIAGAIGRSHASVGLACTFTTVVIAGGFWVLCFSRFVPMAYFGAVVGLTMLCALAADLLLLPALLLLWPTAWRPALAAPTVVNSPR